MSKYLSFCTTLILAMVVATGVSQLDRRYGTLLRDKVYDRRKRLGLFIVPEAAVARADPPLRFHRLPPRCLPRQTCCSGCGLSGGRPNRSPRPW